MLTDVRERRLKVLFVAPERLNNTLLLNALQPSLPLSMVRLRCASAELNAVARCCMVMQLAY